MKGQHNKNIIDKELKLLQMDDLSKQGHRATVKAISSFREVLINRLLSRGQDPTNGLYVLPWDRHRKKL